MCENAYVYDYVCVHTGIYVHTYTSYVAHVEASTCSCSLLSHGSLGLNSGHQAWKQVPSIVEPISWPEKVLFEGSDLAS